MRADNAHVPASATKPAAAPLGGVDGFPELVERFGSVGSVGVIVVDASPLAQVERVYGSEAHQRTLAALAAAVAEVSAGERRPDDRVLVPRLGGDDVALVLFRAKDDAEFWCEGLQALGAAIAEHLTKQASRIFYPYLRSGEPLSVGCSITLRNPVLAAARQLSAALADARAEALLNAETRRRERRRGFLQLLLAEDISVLFEPIVNLSSREVLGYEALVRGPQGSALQSPGAFFAAAEEAGLLFEADTLCRRRALESAHGVGPGKKLFLNCLPSAIRDPSFHGATLRSTLERLRLRPTDVVFEISERESIGNFAVFREARDHFASMGLGIALDDMGVGYSSLEVLMELAPDFMKIDQSLVRGIDTDPPRQELLRALGSVAGKLGAKVIAEGIETSEELTTVQGLGVPFGQGYLLGRAAPLSRA